MLVIGVNAETPSLTSQGLLPKIQDLLPKIQICCRKNQDLLPKKSRCAWRGALHSVYNLALPDGQKWPAPI
jgi:hypothetical protein